MSWMQLAPQGRVPRARYRTSCVVNRKKMYLFGGHDGSRHLNDVHVFSFDTQSWATMKTEGPPPIPRDSHVAVSHGNSMFVFGGSTGSAMNDFHELRLDSAAWAPVKTNSGHTAPCPRFCHVAVSYNDSLFIFGARVGKLRRLRRRVAAALFIWSTFHYWVQSY